MCGAELNVVFGEDLFLIKSDILINAGRPVMKIMIFLCVVFWAEDARQLVETHSLGTITRSLRKIKPEIKSMILITDRKKVKKSGTKNGPT